MTRTVIPSDRILVWPGPPSPHRPQVPRHPVPPRPRSRSRPFHSSRFAEPAGFLVEGFLIFWKRTSNHVGDHLPASPSPALPPPATKFGCGGRAPNPQPLPNPWRRLRDLEPGPDPDPEPTRDARTPLLPPQKHGHTQRHRRRRVSAHLSWDHTLKLLCQAGGELSGRRRGKATTTSPRGAIPPQSDLPPPRDPTSRPQRHAPTNHQNASQTTLAFRPPPTGDIIGREGREGGPWPSRTSTAPPHSSG